MSAMFTSPEVTKTLADERRRAREGEAHHRRLVRLARRGRQAASSDGSAPPATADWPGDPRPGDPTPDAGARDNGRLVTTPASHTPGEPNEDAAEHSAVDGAKASASDRRASRPPLVNAA